MKDSLYFPHDSNASNDPKILALRGVYGSAGYGNYWMIIELLREQEGYRLKLRKYGVDALSIRLGYDRNTTEQFINDCCDTFELLQTDGDYLWCESLSKRMQPLEEKREKARDSIMQRWKNKVDTRTNNERNTNVIRPNNERNTSKVKESKVKESKVNTGDIPSPELSTEIPANLNTEEFKSAFSDYKTFRRERNKRITPTNEKAILARLSKYPVETATQALLDSVANGWSGVFPENVKIDPTTHNRHGPTIKSKNETTAEEAWKTVLEVLEKHGKAKPVFENPRIESAIRFLWGPIADPMSQEDFDETKRMFFEEFRKAA